jgi:HlyD family secretion protein
MSDLSPTVDSRGIDIDAAGRASRASGAASFASTARHARAWRRAAMVVISLGVLGAAGFGLRGWFSVVRDVATGDRATVEERDFNVVLKEKGELKAAKSVDIVNEVEGRSTIISLIPEGTPVKKGDLLVELASDEIENRIQQEELKESNALTTFEAAKAEFDIQRDRNASDIRKAELEIELARLEFRKYEEGEWSQKQRDAEIAIEQAQTTLERRNEDFEAARQLIERQFITQTEFEEDEFNYKKAQWDLEKAINAKKVLEQYTHVADQRKLESNLQEAIKEAERVKKNAEAEETKKLRTVEGKEKELMLIRDQLAKLRRQKEKCRLFAPTEGFVVYNVRGGHFWSDSDQIKEGATVHERQILLSIPDTSTMLAVVRVHEAKTDKLSIGQRATVTVEGIPGQVFTGTVTKIAPLADTQNRWLNPDLKEYETEITLDPTDAPLKPSVTAYSEIMVEAVEDGLAVPVQSVYTKGTRRYVFRERKGGKVEAVPIELGSVGAIWAEVTEGLAGGDEILLAYTDEHKQLIPTTKDTASNGSGRADPPPGDRRRKSSRGERADAAQKEGQERPQAGEQARQVTKAAGVTGKSQDSGT